MFHISLQTTENSNDSERRARNYQLIAGYLKGKKSEINKVRFCYKVREDRYYCTPQGLLFLLGLYVLVDPFV